MKMTAPLLAMLATICARPALSEDAPRPVLTASATIVQEGWGGVPGNGLLVLKITVANIKGCPSAGSVTVEWSSPDTMVFADSIFEATWRSCRRDGTARTGAYRTINIISRSTKSHRAEGIWRVRILDGAAVIWSGTYEVLPLP